MGDAKFKDLLEDEELTSLRLAALATKKKEQNTTKSSESTSALPINSIVTSSIGSESVSNQIPFVQSDRSAFNNNYSWRKQNQSARRRGGAFPKSNQRSNLIVISPVVLNEGRVSEEKSAALILPQHKWCNSGNEDSMSPKTLRKTGPTRFNRHGSDSESSDDSDFEHSDNDSGSNETVLQDEPPENFPPSCDTVSDNVEKKKRRLSFQTLDSEIDKFKSDTFDKNETTSVYNLLKNSSSYADNKSDSYAPKQNLNDGRLSWNHSTENEYGNYKQYNSGHAYTSRSLAPSESFVGKQAKTSVVNNGESNADDAKVFMAQSSDTSSTWQHAGIKTSSSYYSKDPENSRNQGISDKQSKDSDKIKDSKNSVWQHGEGLKTNNSSYPRETSYNVVGSRIHQDDDKKPHYLSEDDLRLELKKRMQEMKSQSSVSENNAWDRNRQRYNYEKDKIGNVSCTNSIENKQDSSNLHGSRPECSFSREKDSTERTSNFNHRRYHRSLSKEKNALESFSNRDRNRFEYKFGSERNRYDRSSSLSKNRSERSSSRGRSRHERSSSREKRREECSSSQSRLKHESTNQDINRRNCSLSPSRNKHERNFNQERDDQEHSVRRSRNERSFSADRKRVEYKSSQNRSERSSSHDKSKRDRSSSSDNRHRRSLSRDRNRHSYYSSRSRNKQGRSVSRDRGRHERSLSDDRHVRNSSHERSRRGSSRSSDSRSERSRSRERSKHSSSHDESSDERSSSEGEDRHKHSSKGTLQTFKHSSNQPKSKQESKFTEEGIQACHLQTKKFEYARNTEKFDKTSTENQSAEHSRLKRSSSKEKNERFKNPPQKYSRVNDSSYKDQYSRSRSSSSESYSSSYSSSSSHSSKPKFRSVPSVIKTVLTKKTDTENRENFIGNKSAVKNLNSAVSQSDVYSTSAKNKDFIDCNKSLNIKSGHMDGDLKASDSNKRVPVHMRLGTFPRKRVIQMPKDVEAAFVNSSSSSDGENVIAKCKRQNIRIITDVYDAKSGMDSFQQKHSLKEKPAKRSPDTCQEKSKRVKSHR